jgi:uncharacterized glyoxalase superfamily protein PhnB
VARDSCSCCGTASDTGSVHLLSHPETVICYRCLDWLQVQREKQVRAGGAGVRVTEVEPMFRVSDVADAADHYLRLGFTVLMQDQAYAVVQRVGLTIALLQADQADGKTSGAIYLHVDDADQLADDWRRAGLPVVGPADFEYGKREGSHTDPDGNLLRFGSPTPTSA